MGNILVKSKALIVLIVLIILPSISYNLDACIKSPVIPFNFLNNIKTQKDPQLFTKHAEMISNSSEDNYRPKIAIDSSNEIHSVWYSRDYPINDSIIYSNSTDNFTNKMKITESYPKDTDPCIAIDNSDTIHIAWIRDSEPGWLTDPTEVYYTNSSVNFSTHKLVVNQTEVDSPQIGCDSFNNVHIAWLGYKDFQWNVFYSNSTDYFSSIKYVSQDSLRDYSISLCVKDDVVHIIWRKYIAYKKYRIAYANSSNDFTETIISKNDAYYESPKIKVDDSGNIHIIYVERYEKKEEDPIDKEVFISFFISYIYLDYFNDQPFGFFNFDVIIVYLAIFDWIHGSNYNYEYFSRIYYSNSSDNFNSRSSLSNLTSTCVWYPDIAIDQYNTCHLIWQGANYYYSNIYRIFYTNSSKKFQEFYIYKSEYAIDHSDFEIDGKNETHFIYSAYRNIWYFNSSELEYYPVSIDTDIIIDLINLYFSIPKMPDLTNLTIISIYCLAAFNVIALYLPKKRRDAQSMGES